MANITKRDDKFFAEIASLLAVARNNAYRAVNTVMVETYWKVGQRIFEHEQRGKDRADYGDYLVSELSRYLTGVLGKGFSEANLWNMRQFYTTFPDYKQFSSQWLGNLSWTNLCIIMRLDDDDERGYYLRESSSENWSKRVLERNIRSGYYRRLLSTKTKGEKKAAAKKSGATAVENSDPLAFIKDPYVLEFLNVPENLEGKESLLENALIGELQNFMLELGKGFSFVSRQFKIDTETDHFYVDLVFYNYLLKCFVVIDLKTTRLSHADIGQMDMYVRMFDKLQRGADDNPTVGIILCADKSETMVKYSILKESKQIFASKYKTVLPTEEEFAILLASKNSRFLAAPKSKMRKVKNAENKNL